MGFLGGSEGKEYAHNVRSTFDPWVREDPLRREWQPTQVFLPQEPHRQRNLMGCSPWAHKESDTTQVT